MRALNILYALLITSSTLLCYTTVPTTFIVINYRLNTLYIYVVILFVMLQDLFKIQATLGGSSGQGGVFLPPTEEIDREAAEEGTDFGLLGPDPDCRIFLTHGVTTMVWLKSHHLLFAS